MVWHSSTMSRQRQKSLVTLGVCMYSKMVMKKVCGPFQLITSRYVFAWAPIMLPIWPWSCHCRYTNRASFVLKTACCDPISTNYEAQRIWRCAPSCPVRILCSNFKRPFLIDLESSNGCTVNGKEIPTSRYYELRSGDTCQFGTSKREYVLLDESQAP